MQLCATPEESELLRQYGENGPTEEFEVLYSTLREKYKDEIEKLENMQNLPKNNLDLLQKYCENEKFEEVKSFCVNTFEKKEDMLPWMHRLFFIACIKGNLPIVKFLYNNKMDLHAYDEYENTGFHYACKNGFLEIVKFFITNGFDIYTEDSCFHEACILGDLEIVKLLLKSGYDMYRPSRMQEMTGFHFACLAAQLHVIRFLLDCGFDVNYLGLCEIGTPFHMSCMDGDLDILKFLLDHGADASITSLSGENAYHFATDRKVVDFLVKQNIGGINAKAVNGCTPVERSLNNVSVTLSLLEAGAILDHSKVTEKLHKEIQNRLMEMTFTKDELFKSFTGRIAQEILNFTTEKFTKNKIENLSNFF